MLSTIDRYLLRELFKVLLAVLLVLSLIMSSVGLVRLLEDAAVGQLHPDVVLPLMGYQVLYLFARTIPAALFLSILAVLGRLYRDSEMTALAACGFGTARIYRAFGYALVPLVIATLWLALWVQPWAAGERKTILTEQSQATAELAVLRPGRFAEYRKGELVFYAEDIDRSGQALVNVFIQDWQQGRPGMVLAERARHTYDPETGEHILTLFDGRRFEGQPGQGAWAQAEFGSYNLRIERTEVPRSDARSARPTAALWRSNEIKDRAELWERLSYPLSLVTLTLVAIPLSRSLPRQGMYWRMFIAFLVYFAFLNLHAVSVSWMKKQVVPEWLGIWWVQGLLLVLALGALALDSAWMRRLGQRLRAARMQRRGRTQAAA